MAPIPQLDLSLSTTESKGSPFYAGEGKEMSRVDSALQQYTITIYISDEKSGVVRINTPKSNKNQPESIEIPTYKMLVTDSLTDEKNSYEVTRDTMLLTNEKEIKSSFRSFMNFDFIKPKKYTYTAVTFEPLHQHMESYTISRYRKLNHDTLSYSFINNNTTVCLFAGDLDTIEFSKNPEQFFLVVDGQKGLRFIGDILYREKFLKLNPVVELKIMKRKKQPKTIQVNKKGAINKIIYL